MRQVYELLKMLTEKYQPPRGSHAVTFDQGKLVITLFVGEDFHSFIAEDDADLDEPVGIIYQQIVDAMDSMLKSSEEEGEFSE